MTWILTALGLTYVTLAFVENQALTSPSQAFEQIRTALFVVLGVLYILHAV